MAREKTRRHDRPGYFQYEARRVWSARERFQLLAYLNWCVQYNQGGFDDTAINHLERATNKKFTQYQIHEQLKAEWDVHGRKSSKYEKLFSEGTAALETLSVRDQKAIERILAGIGPPSEGHRLRSTSRALASSSRTLPTVRPTRASTEPHQSSKTKQTRRQTKQKARSRNPARIASRGQSSEDEIARGHTLMVVKGKDAAGLGAITSTKNSKINNIAGSTVPDSEHKSLPSPSTKARLEKAEAEVSRQGDHVLTLLNRLSEADKQDKELEDSHEAISSLKASHAKLLEKIARMKQRRLNSDSFFRQLGALQSDSLAFGGKSVRQELMHLYYVIEEKSENICQLSSPGSIRAYIPDYAQTWVELLYNGDIDSFVEYAETHEISKPRLVSALLTAGTFKLVMEPVFPSQSLTQSPLLNQYRKHISDQCGLPTLQQLDLIAVKTFLSDEGVMKQVLSEASNTIILPALSFFLLMEGQDQGPTLDADVLRALEEILSQALTIKIEAMPCRRRFRRIFFKSGTSFDAGTMRCEGSQPGNAFPNNLTVRLCLFPAIFYEASDQDFEDGVLPIVNSYPGCFTEALTDELGSLTIVSKAIVLAW